MPRFMGIWLAQLILTMQSTLRVWLICFHYPHAQVKEIGSTSHNGPQGEFNNIMDTVTGLQTINLSEDQA